jgi:PadR family transcriptional regulator
MPAASDDIFETLRQELRRGSLILAVLGQLKVERYGYTLRQVLAEDGLEIDEGALYPMLRRLESQGLLTSEWREEDRRKKRFYRLSPQGEAVLDRLAAEWRAIGKSLERLI